MTSSESSTASSPENAHLHFDQQADLVARVQRWRSAVVRAAQAEAERAGDTGAVVPTGRPGARFSLDLASSSSESTEEEEARSNENLAAGLPVATTAPVSPALSAPAWAALTTVLLQRCTRTTLAGRSGGGRSWGGTGRGFGGSHLLVKG